MVGYFGCRQKNVARYVVFSFIQLSEQEAVDHRIK
jgi:hypothetical protein